MVVAGLVVASVVAGLVLVWGLRERTVETAFELASIDSIPEETWKALSEKKVFWGHQSVGQNIIDGMIEIVNEHPKIQLDIVEFGEVDSIDGGVIFHKKIGRNTRPKSKILAFQRFLESNAEITLDIAMMKYCYIDMRDSSNSEEVFDQYTLMMDSLQEQFPNTVFVHFTIPIESRSPNLMKALKEGVKWAIGRPGVVEDNGVRQIFNQRIRERYSGREPVFDIARFEAIGPDGLVAYRLVDGEKVFLMNRRYSDDGGHLNEFGRQHIAEQLLITLARAANGTGLPGSQ